MRGTDDLEVDADVKSVGESRRQRREASRSIVADMVVCSGESAAVSGLGRAEVPAPEYSDHGSSPRTWLVMKIVAASPSVDQTDGIPTRGRPDVPQAPTKPLALKNNELQSSLEIRGSI